MTHSAAIEKFCRLSPVMPVVTVSDPTTAADLARALVRGGIRVIEVTLRTPVALRAIEVIAREVPEITVGAGTVLSVADLQSSAEAGAAFAISPGATPALLAAGTNGPIFPAGAAGGIAMLNSFAGPFPEARFCPTGGISQATVKSYLDLPNVLCAGGSWLTPADAVGRKNWAVIESLASKAAASRTGAG
jgi:2-dehydro-3-deoxyphosphogluconate aldolase / (4S)-4-hydroxy-2-oxoglutarate aldolase